MKKIASLFILSILAFGIKAQNAPDGNWQPVSLTTDGNNNTNGIEATYQLGTSAGNAVIIIKLVNHNTYPVKASWKDLIVTKNGQNLSGNNSEEAVTIAPKVRVSDDLGNTIQVTIKLSDFKTTAANFKNLSVTDFDIIPIQ